MMVEKGMTWFMVGMDVQVERKIDIRQKNLEIKARLTLVVLEENGETVDEERVGNGCYVSAMY